MSTRWLCAVLVLSACVALGQEGPLKLPKSLENAPAPRSTDEPAGESSSRSTKGEMAGAPLHGPGPETVNEFRQFNPHKAAKSVEVGDYYFRRKNYRAAKSRYQEAVSLNPDSDEAACKLAETLELVRELPGALLHYQECLRIAPEGGYAARATAGIEKLKSTVEASDPGYSDRQRAARRLELAQEWMAQKNYINAADQFREALRFSADLPEAVLGLAQATEQLGDFAAAISGYERYLALQPLGKDAAQAQQAIRRLKPHVSRN